MASKEILFLCHRMPYPPNKGDKIRAFHLLSALAENHTVHLGTFVDDAEDWEHRTTLGMLCAETCYRPLSPRRARIRSLLGLLTGQPLSFTYYHDRPLRRWVDRLMQTRSVDAIVVFSSTMTPYVEGYGHIRRVLDFVDVDSEKWRQYAPTANIPMRWVYAREGRKLLAAERRLAASFDVSIFVSADEAELFQTRAPACSDHVVAISNGVDGIYFDPARDYPDPYESKGASTLVFTGAMDYRANIDAVVWFAYNVFPLIRAKRPGISFCIVGARPAREVLALARLDGIDVTGRVEDVRPYLAHAALAVAPLRIARGLQNKVLEALSMGKRVVLTPEAAAGLLPLSPEYAAIESTPKALAQQVVRFVNDGSNGASDAARDCVLEHYGWDCQEARFLSLIESADPVMEDSPSEHNALAGGAM